MATVSDLFQGTWYITALQQGTTLEFADDVPGHNLTTWTFKGSENQQWQLEGNATACRVRNVQYGLYISLPSSHGSVEDVVSSSEPMDWFIRATNSGYIFSPGPVFASTWNVGGGSNSDNNPVIIWSLDQLLDNSVWIFNSTGELSGSSSSLIPLSSMGSTMTGNPGNPTGQSNGAAGPTSSHGSSTNVGAIVGGTIGGVVVVAVLAYLLWRFGLCSKRPKVPDGSANSRRGPRLVF
ncbi:hypothetical protein CERSUDRAFT_114769 [Gelatoporia subvermispora B]|uniref:Ricin B lectin domain-containing protein n=1 Tax=Ceriporiopsis subvermispora (strain B) TaxID=914234 RepID=M2RDE6_CERS8|nr:hypothetical protein CERSUDRAFT_114769 [Gelatoporia subvermispora B]